jgi:hypothetical protein
VDAARISQRAARVGELLRGQAGTFQQTTPAKACLSSAD